MTGIRSKHGDRSAVQTVASAPGLGQNPPIAAPPRGGLHRHHDEDRGRGLLLDPAPLQNRWQVQCEPQDDFEADCMNDDNLEPFQIDLTRIWGFTGSLSCFSL
jgi:hypothetical protein